MSGSLVCTKTDRTIVTRLSRLEHRRDSQFVDYLSLCSPPYRSCTIPASPRNHRPGRIPSSQPLQTALRMPSRDARACPNGVWPVWVCPTRLASLIHAPAYPASSKRIRRVCRLTLAYEHLGIDTLLLPWLAVPHRDLMGWTTYITAVSNLIYV